MKKVILFPFSLLYGLIVSLRNLLYKQGIIKSISFQVPLITIGNLTIGGTGKTPHIEYLTALLQSRYNVATLSRGYKRKTKGYLMAGKNTSWKEIGDEPMQFYQKFGANTSVAVGEERALAIPHILHDSPETDLILLDDAYQHRSVTPYINILLSDYNRLFYKDHLLPAGRLREPRKAAKRADCIIVSKCPAAISGDTMKSIAQQINTYTAKAKPVFFSCMQYEKPKPVFNTTCSLNANTQVILFAGLANPEQLINYIKTNFRLLQSFLYPDHHDYKNADIKKIRQAYENLSGNNKILLTTEKDRVKITDNTIKPLIDDLPVYELPIKVVFPKNQHNFDHWISEKLNQFSAG